MDRSVEGTVHDAVRESVDRSFAHDGLALLERYVTIPALSPAFDPAWASSGAIVEAAELFAAYAVSRPISGISARVVSIPGRTPALVVTIPPSPGAEGAPSTLCYGHLDKQPPLGAWRHGLGPFTPVLEGDRLYGRGAADDGYALLTALAGVEALEATGGVHGGVTVLVEASEESGSPDLDAHLDALSGSMPPPDLVLCLDAVCPTYDRMWLTTSLRGVITGVLRVGVGTAATHSGSAGGVVPSPVRIARALLGRVEDAQTGDVTAPALSGEISARVLEEVAAAAAELGEAAVGTFDLLPGVGFEGVDPTDRLLRATRRPALAVIGQEGLPDAADAGNVILPEFALTLSVRIPPDLDADVAAAALRALLEHDPPSSARVTFAVAQAASGWDGAELDPDLSGRLDAASVRRFGRPTGRIGSGATIPFLGMLGRRYPRAQIVATGVLGPESNAHGPNEFLHLPTARALAGVVADLLAVGR